MREPSPKKMASLTLLLFMAAAVLLGTVSASKQRRAKQRRPNIVVLMTDDQDVMLRSMEPMVKTREHVIEPGATFSNAFTTSPICCPSRSSFLTGLYAHNHRVLTNTLLCGSEDWRSNYETRSFAKYLSDDEYDTGYFGKYLNEYKGDYIPPGWRTWYGLVKNSKYYNYTVSNNGTREHHRDNYAEDYLTDLVVNKSMDYFRLRKRENRERPVLAVLSFPAPHGPEAGAPQYQGLFQNETSHITPSYNWGPNPDKHWIIQQLKSDMDETQHAFGAMLQQKRLQTLMSVDDAVEKFIGMLRDIGELDNTYVLYTSDHGFHIGQFRLAKGKSMPYDFDIRVPFYLRGPGIPSQLQLSDIVLNIDIAPTILSLAGVDVPDHMDGRNFIPLIKNRKEVSPPWRDRFLIERGKVPKKCKPTEPSKHARLQQLCRNDERHGFPCKPDQLNYCIYNEVDRTYRMKKCKKPRKKPKCKCQTAGGYRFSTERLDENDKRRNKSRCRRLQLDFKSALVETYNRLLGARLNREVGGKQRSKRSTSSNRDQRRLQRGSKRGKKNKRGAKVRAGKTRTFLNNSLRKHRLQPSQCKQMQKGGQRKSCLEIFKRVRGLLVRSSNELVRNSYREIVSKLKSKGQTKSLDLYNACVDLSRPACTCKEDEEDEQEVTTPQQQQETSRSASRTPSSSSAEPEPDVRVGDRAVARRQKTAKKKKRVKMSRNCQLNSGVGGSAASGGGNSTTATGSGGMTCFRLNDHKWTTPPTWQGDERCYCTNSANNTYWCMRYINETHNGLYCVFVTNFVEFYDMSEDPHQLKNVYSEQPLEKISILHNDLKMLYRCNGSRGNSSCEIPRGGARVASQAGPDDDDTFCGQQSAAVAPYGGGTFDHTPVTLRPSVYADDDDEDDDVTEVDPDEESPPEVDEEEEEDDDEEEEEESSSDLDGGVSERWRNYFQDPQQPSQPEVQPEQPPVPDGLQQQPQPLVDEGSDPVRTINY